MTVAGPWSVKGIDPKAKELAKDLARRSGMTLGEWLNQMIIEGGGEAEAPPLQDYAEPSRENPSREPRETSDRRRLLDELYTEATRRAVERAPYEPMGRESGRPPAPYGEPQRRADGADLPKITQALEALSHRIEAAEHRSTLAISGIDQSVMGVLSRLDDLDREQSTVASRYEGAVDDVRDTQSKVIERLRHMEHGEGSRVDAMKALELALGRLAGHLNDGSARAEAADAEARLELESLARRVNRVEAAATDGGSETRLDLERARSELDVLTRRLTKVEAAAESAPNVFAAAGATTEALDGLVRRVSRVEAAAEAAPQTYAESGQTQEALDTLGRRVARVETLSDAASETYARAADTRDELETVARRLGRVETAVDAASTAYADAEKVETVLMHMAERLERAEARTTNAVQSLEASFAGLDARIRTTEVRVGRDGQISAEFDRRFQGLAAELSQQVEASRAEMTHKLKTVADSRIDGIETQLRDLAGHLDQSEKRSAQAIDRMGREVVTIAQSLGERVSQTEARTNAAVEHMGGEMTRIADAMEGRLQRADTAQADALEKLGGEIARIAERLTERLSNSDRRSAEALDEVSEKVGKLTEGFARQQDAYTSDLSDRIRQSEERTAKLLEEGRAKLDQSLAEAKARADAAPTYSPATYPSAYQAIPLPPLAQPASARQDAPDHGPAANADPFGAPDAMFEAPHTPPTPAPPAALAVADTGAADPPPLAHNPPAPIVATPFAAEPAAFPGEALPRDAFQDHNDFEDADFSAFDADDDFQAATPAQAQSPFDTRSQPPIERPIERHDVAVETRPEADAPDHLDDGLDDDFHDDFGMAHDAERVDGLTDPLPDTLTQPHPSAGFSVRDFQPTTAEAQPHSSTRDMIEAARAAARRAAGGRDANPAGVPIPTLEPIPPSNAKPFGMTFLGRRKKDSGGPTLRTMILASSWAAAITAATVGAYHIAHDGTGGKAVARPQMAGAPTAAPTAAPVAMATPQLAVAMAPSLDVTRPSPVEPVATRETGSITPAANAQAGTSTVQTSRALYDTAVQRIESGDLTGVTSLHRAANLGYGPAQFYLGRLYEAGGGGVIKDMAEARRWTERAAQSGEPTAMYNLASYLYAGEGGPKDPAAAAAWFHRAADRGVVNSQFNLAQLYEKGYGVPLNPAEAYKWYLVAAAAGDPEAKASAEALRRKLAPEAQATAARSAAILHAQAVTAQRSAPPALPAAPTSAQPSVQVAASTDH